MYLTSRPATRNIAHRALEIVDELLPRSCGKARHGCTL